VVANASCVWEVESWNLEVELWKEDEGVVGKARDVFILGLEIHSTEESLQVSTIQHQKPR
jgi:hypothetical protein